MNKEVLVEDERRRASGAVAGEGGKSKRQKKSTAPKFPRLNPLGVTVASGSPASAEGVFSSGTSSAMVTVPLDLPTAVPVSNRLRGVVVPVAETEDENIGLEEVDPEIEALFEEADGFSSLFEENVPQRDVVRPGIFLHCFCLSILFSAVSVFKLFEPLQQILRELLHNLLRLLRLSLALLEGWSVCPFGRACS